MADAKKPPDKPPDHNNINTNDDVNNKKNNSYDSIYKQINAKVSTKDARKIRVRSTIETKNWVPYIQEKSKNFYCKLSESLKNLKYREMVIS